MRLSESDVKKHTKVLILNPEPNMSSLEEPFKKIPSGTPFYFQNPQKAPSKKSSYKEKGVRSAPWGKVENVG